MLKAPGICDFAFKNLCNKYSTNVLGVNSDLIIVILSPHIKFLDKFFSTQKCVNYDKTDLATKCLNFDKTDFSRK